MNRRALVIGGTILLVLVLTASGFRFLMNPETRTLDDAARKEAPGKFVHLSDGVTHYQLDGPDTGRTVVLAHGFSVPGYIWDSTAAALAGAGFRVIRYDAYGRGYSDRPDVEYSDKLYERQLGELLDSLHVKDKVDLGGVSAGGYVIGVFAGRHPERVRSLVLVDPVAGKAGATIRPYDLPLVGSYLYQTRAVPKMAEGQASDFLSPEKYPDWADKYRVQMKYKGFGHALLSTRLFRRGMDNDTVYQRVAKANVPVLLIWGEKDNTVPFSLNETVRKAIPSAEFHPIAGAAHLPNIEQAHLTDSIIVEFLRRSQ